MKKTILTAITLLCLSTPLQAFETYCNVLDAPCYMKSNTTILRKEPSEDSPIVQQLSPARDSDRLYFFFRAKREVKGKLWGYFEPVEPIVDMITGKKMAGGWASLDNAFHDVYDPSVKELEQLDGQHTMFMYRPKTPVYFVETKNMVIVAPGQQVMPKPEN